MLITGTNDFVADRSTSQVKAAVRASDADADVSETTADLLGPGAMAEISSPSLFASARCVIVRTLESLPDDAVDSLLAYAGAPAPDVALVLHHTGGNKLKGVLDKLRKAGVHEIKATPLKKWELPEWVVREFRGHQVSIDAEAATALVDAVGEDMRALAGAASQLAADLEGAAITTEIVRRYFGGRAEVRGFVVADAVVEGRVADALEQLRWAFSTKTDPVLITSAVSGSLRSLARLASAPAGLRGADLAREIDVPAWKLKNLQRQGRGWTHRGLADALVAAAEADAAVKGAGGDREWACEKLLIDVYRARRAA